MRNEEHQQTEMLNVITQSQKEAFNYENSVQPNETEYFYWMGGTIIDNSLNYSKVPRDYQRKYPKVEKREHEDCVDVDNPGSWYPA